VRVGPHSLADLAASPIGDAGKLITRLKLGTRDATVAEDIIKEIVHRLALLDRLGLGYLTLDRAAPTLSGGEAQRIRLAAQLGSNLRGVCYVLDEPTIGLHPRDNTVLLETLGELRDRGNTVVVVEHDEDTMRAADHLIDIGPGAGKRGGELVASGSLKQIVKSPQSLTGRCLGQPLAHPMPREMQSESPIVGTILSVTSAHENNLRVDSLDIPRTLVRDVIGDNVSERLSHHARKKGKRGPRPVWHGCASIDNWDSIDRVLEVDQTPIGKTPRRDELSAGCEVAVRQLPRRSLRPRNPRRALARQKHRRRVADVG